MSFADLSAPASSHFPTVTPEVVGVYDVAGPRYTSYPTVPEWSDNFGPDDYALALRRAKKRPLAYYVHLPFCESRCTYCGCNVVITHDRARVDGYLDRVEREMDLVSRELGQKRSLSQIHWGGGTPTFLDPGQIERLWRAIESRFDLEPHAEVAIELDPRVTTFAQLRLLRGLGFNRISLGVQDFDASVQEAVARKQSVEDTWALVSEARRLGFSSINFDLIYGLPNQTEKSWKDTLGKVLELGPDRMAVYSFAYVPEVRPHQKRLALYPMPAGVEKLALFAHAYDAFVSAGYRAIGMDHFARPGDDLVMAQGEGRLTRNFQGYTASGEADVVAFGVSAISDVGGAYAQSTPAMVKYLRAIDEGRLATVRGFALTEDDMLRRRLIRDLMCNFQVDLGPDAQVRFASELAALDRHAAEGLLVRSGSHVELTSLGRVFVRNVAMSLDAHLENTPRSFSRTI